MTELFITDIDGCLMDPMKVPDWEVLTEIRSLNEQSKRDPSIPALTLCTGRPLNYAEAVAQMMGINHPVVFESAGIFDPSDYEIHLNGFVTNDNKKVISDIKGWLKQNVLDKYDGFSLEFSKVMDAGVIHPDEAMIRQVLPMIREYIAANYRGVEVHSTIVSVNIIFKKNNKKAGIQRLCERAGLSAKKAAFIGDSSGDIPGLKIVGRPFAPENAHQDVKKVTRTLQSRSTRAVLETYRELIAKNRQ